MKKKNRSRRRAKVMAYTMLMLLLIMPAMITYEYLNYCFNWYSDVLTAKTVSGKVVIKKKEGKIKYPICPGLLKK